MIQLVLIPTEAERRFLQPTPAEFIDCNGLMGEAVVEVCGFGQIAAAARTAELIARHRPSAVHLIGIAGAFDDRLKIGSARRFERVICHGIGVGEAERFRSAGEIGWHQWPGSPPSPSIGDVVDCSGRRDAAAASDSPLTLLSACAASADPEEARRRRARYPEADAEEMEGFAAAVACTLAGVPLRIIRGISNRAGDRNLSRWKVKQALEAAAELLKESLSHPTRSPAIPRADADQDLQ